MRKPSKLTGMSPEEVDKAREEMRRRASQRFGETGMFGPNGSPRDVAPAAPMGPPRGAAPQQPGHAYRAPTKDVAEFEL